MARQRAGLPGAPDDLAALARAWVAETCSAQGLPVKVTCRATVTQVAVLLGVAPANVRRGAALVAGAPEERRAA